MEAHPEWAELFGTCGNDDLEVAISAPVGSNAGHLIIFTAIRTGRSGLCLFPGLEITTKLSNQMLQASAGGR